MFASCSSFDTSLIALTTVLGVAPPRNGEIGHWPRTGRASPAGGATGCRSVAVGVRGVLAGIAWRGDGGKSGARGIANL
eukprot:2177451-Rhodomonas_salina.1